MLNTRALIIATVVGTLLQTAMVVTGHTNRSIASLFAVGGMGISFAAGLLYAWMSRSAAVGSLAFGGALAGGMCALIGIFISHLLGDVPASLLLLGTVSSAVTGAIGGAIGKLFSRTLAVTIIIATAAASTPAPVQAQQAATSTKDFAWLAGRWEGRMNKGSAVAQTTFQAPVAGAVTGIMRLISDEKILVVELISIVDTPAGPEMRFRHFSPTLEAYEPSFRQTLRLKTHTEERSVFENLIPYDKTLMSTQPRTTTFNRTGPDTFIAHSDIIGDDGKPAVIEVVYRRVSST